MILMKTIYYTNGQLNKRKTIVALIRYNLNARLHGQKPIKIITESSYKNSLMHTY